MLGSLALVPGTAQAHYPYEWSGATPPDWFQEAKGADCQPVERAPYLSDGNLIYPLEWQNPGGAFRGGCFKPFALGEAERGFYCHGTVEHNEAYSVSYDADWTCWVDVSEHPGYCFRHMEFGEGPLGTETADLGHWYVPSQNNQFESLGPCDPASFIEDFALAVEVCERAKARVERARKKLKQADGPDAKRKARKNLKKAKQRAQLACAES